MSFGWVCFHYVDVCTMLEHGMGGLCVCVVVCVCIFVCEDVCVGVSDW